ncbi:TPA: YtxH domain-containing protein [Streptococcus suis]|nr:YtxH domain-containing protein [Streptococcus suis]
MVKKSSIFTSILLGVAGGAAAAIFLTSKSGKALKERVVNFTKDYQENYEEINVELLHKAQDLKEQAVGKYQEVKEQFETGELTVDDLMKSGKEKAQVVKEQSKERIEQIKEKIAEQNLTTGDLIASIKEKTVASLPTREENDIEQEDIELTIDDLVEPQDNSQ